MNLTLHFIAKDFRCLWPYLTLLYVLLVLHAALVGLGALIGTLIIGPYGDTPFLRIALNLLLELAFVLKVCLLAVMVARLVQGDSTVGSSAFWLSRPVSGGRLLLSKALFLVLTVILPVLLVESGVLLVHGVLPFDTLRSIPQIILPVLLATLALMMLASLTSSLPRMMFLGILSVVAVVLVNSAMAWLRPALFTMGGQHVAAPLAVPGPGWGWTVSFLLPFSVAGAVVFHQFLTRRTIVSGTLALSGLLLAFLLLEFRPGDFWPVKPEIGEEILDSEQVSARVAQGSLALDRESALHQVFGLSPEDAGLESGRGKRIFLKGRIELEGLPPYLSALPGLLSARMVLPSGEALAVERYQSPRWLHLMMRYYTPFVPFSTSDSQGSDLLRQVPGEVRFLSARGDELIQPSMDLFRVSEDFHERYRGVEIVYSAQVDFFLVRTDVAATLRLERGTAHDRGSDRFEILWVDRSGGEFLFVELSHRLHRVAGEGWTTVTHVLRNPSTREVLLGSDHGFSVSNASTGLTLLGFSPALTFPSLEFESLQLTFKLSERGQPLPETWLQGAELVRIETTHLGVFSKTIRIEDLVMDRIPGP